MGKEELKLNTLIIDTSTKFEIIAIKKENNIFDETLHITDSHSQTVFANIELCLQKASLNIEDINLIGVGTGPGSFTGIRIAVSTARMLAQLLNIPIVDICSQDIFANSIEVKDGENIIAAFEAKKKRVFAAVYKKHNNELIQTIEAGDYELTNLIDSCSSKKIHLVGEGIQKHIDTLHIKSNEKTLNILEDVVPSGEAACILAEKKYSETENQESHYDRIIPNYARISDAEFHKKQGNRKPSP